MTLIESRRVDLTPLVTHHFALEQVEEAIDLVSHQRDGVLKVALYPGRSTDRGQLAAIAAGRLDDEC
jgi:hypothetical protein